MIKLALFWLIIFPFSVVGQLVHAESLDFRVVSTERKLLQYSENGEIKGPSAEIFKLLMQASGLQAEVEFMPWARAYQQAESEKNTLIFSLIRNEQREEKFHWLLPVSRLIQTFIGKSAQISQAEYQLAKIKDKTTVVVRDTFGHKLLLKNGFSESKNIYVVSTLERALNLFFNNKVDFIFTEPNVVRRYMTEYGLVETDLIMAPLLKGSLRLSYIAANKNTDAVLINKFKKAARQVGNTPEYKHYFEVINHKY